MRILMSGSSGMIGSALRDALEARGDTVAALVRTDHASGDDVAWDPTGDQLDEAALAAGSFDVVVHLAGEPLDGRWTDEKKVEIRASRVLGTKLLAAALARLGQRPSALLMASATGFYGDRGEELLTEDAAIGGGFLAPVVDEWERAADAARDAGMRVAYVRMAPVQSPRGGALAKQLLPFRLGVGGRVGSGRQWWPWVGLHEVVRMWLHVIDSADIEGPVNAVGPTPARNAEYAKALGRVLRRPTILPIPPLAVKVLYGSDLVDEMLLSSQKAVPARLEATGFEFQDRTIEQALRRELER